MNVNTSLADAKKFFPRQVMLNAPNDKLHRNSYSEKIKRGKEQEYKIAYPNDRGKSIAPFDRNEKYK